MGIYHLAIDIGAGSGRAVIGRIEASGKISIREIHRFPTQWIDVNGNKLTDIYQIYREVLNALALYGKEYDEPLGSIGVDTWSTDFGILDKDGKLLGLPFFYRDNRTDGTADMVDERIGREQVHLWTGGRFDACSTLHQMVSLKRDGDVALEKGDRLLFLGDLLNYFLTGVARSEHSVASYSQMFNMRDGRWEDRIFDAFDIPKRLQPEIIYPGDVVGKVSPEILKQTGLSGEPLVIAPAIHDTASAALAVPFDKDCAFISSGTWSLVGMVLREPMISHDSYLAQASSTGMGFGKVLFKKNITGLWIFQECMKSWKSAGIELSYEQLDKLAEEAKPHTAYIDSDDPVFFRPEDMVKSIQGYLAETGQGSVAFDDVGQIVRIIYESMAMKYRKSLELMVSVCGGRVSKLSIVGGGSRIDLINRFTASATGLPVYAGPNEASSIGNIMMQVYGMGELSGEAEIREIVRQSFPIREYLPEGDGRWSGAYEDYCAFLERHSRERCAAE